MRRNLKINRNSSTVFNHSNHSANRDTISPEVFVEQLWVDDDDDIATGVQIIELNSSDNPLSSPEENDENFTQAWRYANLDHRQSKDCFLDKRARERRRNLNKQTTTNTYPDTAENESSDLFFSSYFDSGDNAETEHVVLNHQMNCFTIIDNHNNVDFDVSSDDEYKDVEEMKYEHSESQYAWNDDQIATYDPDLDTEKRMIWIYSFKNKRLLSENDFELVNIPSKDSSSTTSSIEDDRNARKEVTHIPRVATPIPPSFIPRNNLFLKPTLPTVTEVSEPNRQSSSNQTEKSLNENVSIKQKPKNGWFKSENAQPNREDNKQSDATNVVNWMALSPRDRRRIFRNTNIRQQDQLPILREVSSYAEKKLTQKQNTEPRQIVSSQKLSGIEGENNSARSVRTTINSLVTRNKEYDTFDKTEKCMNTEPRQVLTTEIRAVNVENHLMGRSFSTPRSSLTRNNNTYTFDNTIDKDMEKFSPNDRGDHNNHKKYLHIKNTGIPRIKFSPKASDKPDMTDPIENLDSNNWIAEKPLRKGSEQNKNTGFLDHGDSAGTKLMIRNLPLLKPAEWTEYLPITGSMPSLHLSLDTSDEETESCLRRLAKCFRCCKLFSCTK